MKGLWKRIAAGLLLSAAAVTAALPVSAAWQQADGGDWWYSYADGSYPSDGFAQIDGSWYLFDESGYMLTGWQQVDSTWYYLDENGVMQTGWLQLPDGWYFLNGGGAMQTGWLQNGGCWYYLDGGGRMATGWRQVGSTWYYMDESGHMVTGERTIDGVAYTFDDSGAMVGDGSGIPAPDLSAIRTVLDGVTLTPQSTADSELNQLIGSWMAEHFSSGMSGYDKAAAIYDYLLTLSYGTPEAEDVSGLSMSELLGLYFDGPEYNARLLLSGGKGTEEHFAAALAALLRAAGFDAAVTEGIVFSGSSQQNGRSSSWVTVAVGDSAYIFDPAADLRAGSTRQYFCRTADELDGRYQPVDSFPFQTVNG